ncbi:MAG: hypothetical protein JXA14_10165 [Anaerolineae bacterium]|nr:hypothetical protein [Anaerolineae bacterium]
MSTFAKRYFVLFHIFVLGFFVLGVYLNGSEPGLVIAMYALALVLNLGLIGVLIKDVHQQGVAEQEKIVWSLLLVFLWPSMWAYACWFGLGWRRARA